MTKHQHCLSKEQCQRFYDWFGERQDRQQFYEKPALDRLIKNGRFIDAHSVFEFGCGTGMLAQELLATHLPLNATYEAVDLSSKMVELATGKVKAFRERVSIRQSIGELTIPASANHFDRFVTTYVFDLLSDEDIEILLAEAHRVLKPEGLLCFASLTRGERLCSRIVSAGWQLTHRIWPQLVGGCRPIEVLEFFKPTRWQVAHHSIVQPYCIPSEIVVAQKVVNGHLPSK